MNRKAKQVIIEAARLAWQDIRTSKNIIISISVYFIILWKFFRISCSLVLMTGYPCPTCGFTRAGRLLISGNFVEAWKLHPFVYVLVIFIVVAGIKRYIRKQSLQSLKKWTVMIAIAIGIFYVYRMYMFFPGEPPISYYGGNWMRRMLDLYISQ